MNSIVMRLSEAVAHTINELYQTSLSATDIVLQETRPEFEGDYTFVVFPILKASKKKPMDTATEIGNALTGKYSFVASVEVVNGFLNISLSSKAFSEMLNEVASHPSWGHKTASQDAATYMIEYSSPNTNKPLHLGHVRNNLLGYSLARIVEANGYNVVKTNIVNDRGIHICKSMVAWLHWGNGETPQCSGKKGDHLVGDYYVLFDKHYKAQVENLVAEGHPLDEAKEHAPLMQEAREMLRKWEQGDTETLALWNQMNHWVYEGFDETYQRMGVDFDKIYYESDTYKVGKEEVLRGLSEGLFVKHSDGSVWADLRNDGLDEKILLRSDGTSVYITQDIGTAKMRYNDYPIDKMVYVVGNEQEYHFKVLSLLLSKLGFSFGKDLVHFSYGMVNLPEGRMKSREGTVVDADDLMDEMITSAYQLGEEVGRSAQLPEEEKKEIARRVGLGALKYFILKVDPRKNMTFNPKESIDFNGNTAAFIQYTYARIRSLEEKALENNITMLNHTEGDWDKSFELHSSEKSLIRSLNAYPQVVNQAFCDFSPALIANYTYDLVKLYNSFYHDCPILREENKDILQFRLKLSTQVAKVIALSMSLLGIEMPEKM